MDERIKEKITVLEKQLAELKSLDPSHCDNPTEGEGFMGHSMPVDLYEKIDALEREIAQLKKIK